MSTRTKKIIGWVLTTVLALLLATSAADKIIASPHAAKTGALLGLSVSTYRLLGIVELLSALLFVFTRTGLLGTLLLASYLGGAIATHLLHQQDVAFPAVFEVVLWSAAALRFPELTSRLFGRILQPGANKQTL